MKNSQENLSLNNPIVTILDDEDDGNLAPNDISLREAIVHSQDGSTISFDNSLKNKTILLTRGELSIDKNLTIQGFNNGQLTIDGNNKSSVFNINNLDKSVDVTIDNLTITGGNARNQDGSGIRNTENLTINNSIITGNSTTGSGGGISNFGSVTTINNSVISNNSAAERGGGINIDFPYTVNNNPAVIINNSLISNNSAAGGGGGIYNNSGGLRINDSTIDQNTASGSGGGINSDSTTKIIDSTISNNQADSGAGFNSSGFDSDSTFINSTISGNTAKVNGGGIFVSTEYGYHTVTNSTITNNSAPDGAGIDQSSAIANITSSIIAGNVDNNDVNGAGIISGGNNLIGNGDGAPDFVNLFNGDLVGTANKPIDPQLGELKDNGGNTFTHALLPESIAINTGSNPEKLTTDQRGKGFERVLFDASDIGAFEADTDSIYDLPFLPPEPTSRIVTTLDDEDDGDLSADDISLREAILESNPGDTITFDPRLSDGKITLTLGELAVDKSLNITGLGADKLTIDADNKSRVFSVDNGSDTDVDVAIAKLTITGANAGEEGGGGIDNHENLTVNQSIISGNSAKYGGGVLTNDFATTTINNSTIKDNSADSIGGGVSNLSSYTIINNSTISGNSTKGKGGRGGGISSASSEGGTTTVNNSTISGNIANEVGGGIDAFDTRLEVTNSTITDNTAKNSRNFTGGNGSGVSVDFAIGTFTSSIIAGNAENDDFTSGGNITSGGNNLIGNGENTEAFQDGVNQDIVGTADAPVKPRLGELKDNGGLTLTYALLPDSLAINVGSNPEEFTTDQRGLERSIQQTDIGAYEVQSGSIDFANLKIIDGDINDNTLTGTTKRNILNGKGGNDTLNGGQQFDRLNGGDGDDVLIGKGGIDVLLGEEGEDLFYLENIKGSLDWIRDFELNQDRLGLADNITYDELEISGRVNSFISYQGKELAVVLGVSPSQLTIDQFKEL